VVELKPRKPNIATTMILKPSVAIMIETHSEIHTTPIKANNQMALL
jgi:hypothetical protein